jgi:TonB family protein
MSRTHLALSCAAVAIATIAGTRYAVSAFPLQQSTTGPREQATAITPENPIPRRRDFVRPAYPMPLVGSGLQAFVTAQVVLDESGLIAETRRVYTGVSRVSSYSKAQPSVFDDDAASLFWQSVDDAVRRWYYDAPWKAPIAFPVSFRFDPDNGGLELNATTAPYSPPPLWHAGTVSVGDGVAPPRKIKDVRPIYPTEAQDARVQGVVIVEVRVEPDGRISNTRVMRSIPELDKAAVDAVSQWEFSPTLDGNGRPIPIIMTITVQFTLS